jgi:hypothetical protein
MTYLPYFKVLFQQSPRGTEEHHKDDLRKAKALDKSGGVPLKYKLEVLLPVPTSSVT